MPFALGGSLFSYLLGSDPATQAADPGAALQVVARCSFEHGEPVGRKIPNPAMVVGQGSAECSDEEMAEKLLGEPCAPAPPAVPVAEPEFTAAGVHREAGEGPGIEVRLEQLHVQFPLDQGCDLVEGDPRIADAKAQSRNRTVAELPAIGGNRARARGFGVEPPGAAGPGELEVTCR